MLQLIASTLLVGAWKAILAGVLFASCFRVVAKTAATGTIVAATAADKSSQSFDTFHEPRVTGRVIGTWKKGVPDCKGGAWGFRSQGLEKKC